MNPTVATVTQTASTVINLASLIAPFTIFLILALIIIVLLIWRKLSTHLPKSLVNSINQELIAAEPLAQRLISAAAEKSSQLGKPLSSIDTHNSIIASVGNALLPTLSNAANNPGVRTLMESYITGLISERVDIPTAHQSVYGSTNASNEATGKAGNTPAVVLNANTVEASGEPLTIIGKDATTITTGTQSADNKPIVNVSSTNA